MVLVYESNITIIFFIPIFSHTLSFAYFNIVRI